MIKATPSLDSKIIVFLKLIRYIILSTPSCGVAENILKWIHYLWFDLWAAQTDVQEKNEVKNEPTLIFCRREEGKFKCQRGGQN